MAHSLSHSALAFQVNQQMADANPNIRDSDAESGEMMDGGHILDQLNQLRQWQESQRQILISSQMDQQRLLQWEKEQLYAMLGVNSTHEDIDSPDGSQCASNADAEHIDGEPLTQPAGRKSPQNVVPANHMQLQSPSMNQLDKIIANLATNTACPLKSPSVDHANIPKRPFLKRGEGLTSRFKIAPDAFRLDKLPKYKYLQRAPKHAQPASQHQDKQRHKSSHGKNDTTAAATDAGEVSACEGRQRNHGTQSSSDGAQRTGNNVPSRASHSHRNVPQLKLRPTAGKRKLLQNSLAKDASTYTGNANFEQGIFPQLAHVSQQNYANSIDSPFLATATTENAYIPCQAQRNEDKPFTLSSQLQLNTPIRNLVQAQQNAIDELGSFTRLEQEFADDSPTATMERQMFDESLALQFKHGLNLSPHAIVEVDEEEDDGDDEAFEREQAMAQGRRASGDDNKRVRFSANAFTIQEDEDEHADFDAITPYKKHFGANVIGVTSSPYAKSTESFLKFKEKLFDRKLKQKFQNRLSVAKDFELSDVLSNKSYLDDDAASAASSVDNPANECDLPKRQLQEQLLSLEQEIKSFREQNSELTKLIREHEIIRLTFDQERADEEERMQSERVAFEMYMDEQQRRMVAERAEWEKRAKESRAVSRSEKDELARLREKCAKHEGELSEREQKHVAAQARVRAQLRSAEKELKEHRLEVENLRRENKKLDTENIRLRRQCNNKLLSEINKSISRLAKTSNENDKENQAERGKHGVKQCSNKSAHKSVVARVTSVKESTRLNQMRSRSVPNLQDMDGCDTSTLDLCSPSASDAENSESADDRAEESSYFPRKLSNRSRSNSERCAEPAIEPENTSASATKRTIENADGSKDVWYPNGNLKKVSADGMCIRMLYFNKDIKETDIREGVVKYYYAETNTWQTSYPDGLEIYEYPK